MTDRKKLIAELQSLYRTKLGRKKGVVMRSYTTQEVGIWLYNYDVITRDGMYSGYWTDPKQRLADKTIVSRIVDSEDLQEWEDLDDGQLAKCLEFLRQYTSQ